MNTGGARREAGFAEQRLVVVPHPVLRSVASHPLLRGLRVTDAGYFPRAHGHYIQREKGAAGAVMILCREGRGHIWTPAGGERKIEAGDVALLAPETPHAYGADDADPWTIQWTHFEGDEVRDWWAWLRLPREGGVLRLQAGIAETLDLGRVHERLGYSIADLVAAAAALRWTLANLEPTRSQERIGASTREAIENVEAWMQEHSAGQVSLGSLARKAGLSPAHFASRFRERFGFSPVDYFLRLKMRRACHLLDHTSWPVQRVATECGFEDPLYFSRRFHRVMGMPPTDYRKVKKG